MAVKVVESNEHFETLLKEACDKLVVVDFYADWCGPCRVMGPKVEEMAQTETNVVFLKVNVDTVSELAEQYEVAGIPMFIFFKGGEKIDSFSGANKMMLQQKVDEHKS